MSFILALSTVKYSNCAQPFLWFDEPMIVSSARTSSAFPGVDRTRRSPASPNEAKNASLRRGSKQLQPLAPMDSNNKECLSTGWG